MVLYTALSRFTKVLTNRDVRERWGGAGRPDPLTERLRCRGEPVPIVPVAMTGERGFEETPDALDPVALRAIGGEPARTDALTVRREPRPQGRRWGVGRIIHDPHPRVLRRAGRDRFEERGEFGRGGCWSLPGRPHTRPIRHGSEAGDPVIGSGGGDAGRPAALAPARYPVGLGMEGAFVTIAPAESAAELSPFFAARPRCWPRWRRPRPLAEAANRDAAGARRPPWQGPSG